MRPSKARRSREIPGYTAADMAAATAIMRAEDPRWQWMFPVTRMTRDFVTAQFPVLQVSYIVAVALIYFSASIESKISAALCLFGSSRASLALSFAG